MSIIKSTLNIKDEFKIYTHNDFTLFFDAKESGECTFLISPDGKTFSNLSTIQHVVSESKPGIYVFGNSEFPEFNNKYITVKYFKCNVNAFVILYSINTLCGDNKLYVSNCIFYNIEVRTNAQIYLPYSTNNDTHPANILGRSENLHKVHRTLYQNLCKYLVNDLLNEVKETITKKMLYDEDLKYLHFSAVCEAAQSLICVLNNKISANFNAIMVFKKKYYIIAFENTEKFIVYDYNLNELYKFDKNVTLISVTDTQIEYFVKYGNNVNIFQVIDFVDLLKSKNIIKSEIPSKMQKDLLQLQQYLLQNPQQHSSHNLEKVIPIQEPPKYDSISLQPSYKKSDKDKCVIM